MQEGEDSTLLSVLSQSLADQRAGLFHVTPPWQRQGMLHHRAGELSTADCVLHHRTVDRRLVSPRKPYSVEAKLWSSTALLSKPSLAELTPASPGSSALLAAVLVRESPACTGKPRASAGRAGLSLFSPCGPQIDRLKFSTAPGERPWRSHLLRTIDWLTAPASRDPSHPPRLGCSVLVACPTPSPPMRAGGLLLPFLLHGRIGRMGLFPTTKELQSQQHVSPPSSLDWLGACRYAVSGGV